MQYRSKREFDRLTMAHLPGAYNLARWLLHTDDDAEDAVQDAFVSAYQHFADFRGRDAKPWLLTIVRNAAYSVLRKRQTRAPEIALDELFDDPAFSEPGPESAVITADETSRLREAVERLPAEFREIIVLREIEDLSYKEISDITGVPIGTVMSRLNRARKRLRSFARPMLLEQANDL